MSARVAAVSVLGRALPRTRAGRAVILIYHRVLPQPDPMFPGEVDARRFEEQMSLLREHCRPLSLLEVVDGLASGGLPERAVTVTFDDGYADNATVALPILQRHGIPATFFVAPGFLDGGRMWNDTVIETVRRAPSGPLDLSGAGLGVVSLGAEDARGPVADSLIRSVKHLPQAERQRRVDELSAAVGVRVPDDLMMTSAEVRKLADAGMEIGAHTLTHPILRTLEDAAAGEEIARSRAVLESITARPVRYFAYPNGRPGEDYGPRDRDLVASQGFECALATRAGAASRQSDRFQLPRFTPWDTRPERWLARLLWTFGSPA